MRTIGVVTVGRSDYGIYLPLLKRIRADKSLRLWLFAGGMHLSREFGLTIRAIKADGFRVREKVDMHLAGDTPRAISESIGLGVKGFAAAFARSRPDILVVLGDRFDMFAAAVAALPFKIPVAHIHGGEITRGAIDDSLRHAMTKLSHLHFVSAKPYARRVIQLGEEPWRVTVSGAPGLDNLRSVKLLSKKELEEQYAVDLATPPLLVTFHSTTLEFERAGHQADELLAALDEIRRPIVFTLPNADTGGRVILQKIKAFIRNHRACWLIENLGTQAYFSFMAVAAAMVGNSSSGIIEAPSFKLPVVNVGTRQDGRIRVANVIDVDCRKSSIVAAIRRALDASFRKDLRRMPNPYGDGRASARILARLKSAVLDDRLVTKRFHDLAVHVPAKPAAVGKKCVVIGGGGHARMLIEGLKLGGAFKPCAVLDTDHRLWGGKVLGVPVLGGDDKLSGLRRRRITHFAVGVGGVGDNRPRREIFAAACKLGLVPATVIHPSAICSLQAVIEAGAQLLPRCIVNGGARIGANAIINSGAIIEHDCVVGAHAHVATGAVLAGGVRVGPGAHIGAAAVVKQCVRIGAGAVVGAGSVVVKNVPAGSVVVGVPARPM